MRGIPSKIATRQDVINLAGMLDPAQARDVVLANAHLLEIAERQSLLKEISLRKRALFLAAKRGRQKWVRYHNLRKQISLLEQENEDLMCCIRKVQEELAALKTERDEIQKEIKL